MKRKISIYITLLFILFINVLNAQNKSQIPLDSTKYPVIKKQLIKINKEIKNDSTNCSLFFKRNLIHFELANIKKAKYDLDKAIQLCPNDTISYFYYYQRGSLHDKMGLIQDAYNDFTKSIELNPNFAGGYLDRGILLTNKGYYKEGKVDIDLAIKLKPNWGDAYFATGTNYDIRNDEDMAIVYYLKSIEYISKGDRFVHLAYNNIGVLYNKKGEYKEAIQFFNKALKIENKYTLALTNRAESKFRLGNKKSACEDLKKAILLGREDLKLDYNNFCK